MQSTCVQTLLQVAGRTESATAFTSLSIGETHGTRPSLSLLDVPSKLDKAVGPKLDAKSKIHFVPSLPTPAATSCFDVEREAASAQLSQTFGK